MPQIGRKELAEQIRQDAVTVLDVRGHSEWEAGHLPGVENIPVGYLAERVREIPTDRPVVLHCQGGTRSAIAASLLRAKGLRRVANFGGGFVQPTSAFLTSGYSLGLNWQLDGRVLSGPGQQKALQKATEDLLKGHLFSLRVRVTGAGR